MQSIEEAYISFSASLDLQTLSFPYVGGYLVRMNKIVGLFRGSRFNVRSDISTLAMPNSQHITL